MQGKVLGVERRRRWNAESKARLVEETLVPGAVISEIARRHGVAKSLLFTWRRQARAEALPEGEGSMLLHVEIELPAPPPSSAVAPSRNVLSRRRHPSGMIEIELGASRRVRVDKDVDADALRRVLSVLGER